MSTTGLAPFVAFGSDAILGAAEEWGGSGLCGPAALAACLGWTLDAVRPHLGDFEVRGYMSPPMIQGALRSAGFVWRDVRGDGLPVHGLVRVQWSGSWLYPGTPLGAAACRTHWTASKSLGGVDWAFDVNVGWEPLSLWERATAPLIAASVKGCDGTWLFRERWEVRKRR